MIVNRTSVMVMLSLMGILRKDTCIFVTMLAVLRVAAHRSFLLRHGVLRAQRFNSIHPTKRLAFCCVLLVALHSSQIHRDSIQPTDFDEEFTNEKTTERLFADRGCVGGRASRIDDCCCCRLGWGS